MQALGGYGREISRLHLHKNSNIVARKPKADIKDPKYCLPGFPCTYYLEASPEAVKRISGRHFQWIRVCRLRNALI